MVSVRNAHQHQAHNALNPVISAFLKRRGLSPDDLTYLQAPTAQHQHNPFLLDGVNHWIDVLHSKKGEKIAIMPDYDADGVLSGTLLRVALDLCGFGNAYLYNPKTRDGYGLTPRSVDNIQAACPHATTLITTDNGSNAHEGVAYAKEKGWSVLVTDHHVALADPVADAVVNPNRRHRAHVSEYPFPEICGTAVIYKVMSAYAAKYIQDEEVKQSIESLLLLVGMATISDVMPLLNENRYFVTESVRMLERFVDSHTPARAQQHAATPLGDYYRGMDLLVATLNQKDKLKYGVNSDTFGFTIGPMLNSPRRMLGDSAPAFALFQPKRNAPESSPDSLISDDLYVLNEDRKTYVRALTEKLFDHIEGHENLYPSDCAIFNAEMLAGVAGLLSNSFTSKYDLPSIAFSVPASSAELPDGYDPINVSVSGLKTISGSARAPGWFNIYEFLTDIQNDYPDLILGWGGHPQAAGITLAAENYTPFRRIFIDRLKHVLYEMATQRDDSADMFPIPVGGEFLFATDTCIALAKGFTGETPFHVILAKGNTPIAQNNELMDAVRFFVNTAPFGQGFPEPTFSVVFAMNEVKTFYMGAAKQHVKFTLPNGLVVINWNGAKNFKVAELPGVEPRPDERIFSATGKLSINEFNGCESLQIILNDCVQVS